MYVGYLGSVKKCCPIFDAIPSHAKWTPIFLQQPLVISVYLYPTECFIKFIGKNRFVSSTYTDSFYLGPVIEWIQASLSARETVFLSI